MKQLDGVIPEDFVSSNSSDVNLKPTLSSVEKLILSTIESHEKDLHDINKKVLFFFSVSHVLSASQ